MNARAVEVRVPTLLALQAYLHSHPAAGSLDEVVDLALNAWLARQTASRQGEPGVGYHWKSLFLPAGTQVRFNYDGGAYHAEVVGDELIYRGKSVSPRGMLMAIAGLSGNAWNLLRIRRPGDRHFSFASALRAQQARDDEIHGCEPENALTRRVVDALGRIEERLRDQCSELRMRTAVDREQARARAQRCGRSPGEVHYSADNSVNSVHSAGEAEHAELSGHAARVEHVDHANHANHAGHAGHADHVDSGIRTTVSPPENGPINGASNPCDPEGGGELEPFVACAADRYDDVPFDPDFDLDCPQFFGQTPRNQACRAALDIQNARRPSPSPRLSSIHEGRDRWR